MSYKWFKLQEGKEVTIRFIGKIPKTKTKIIHKTVKLKDDCLICKRLKEKQK